MILEDLFLSKLPPSKVHGRGIIKLKVFLSLPDRKFKLILLDQLANPI